MLMVSKLFDIAEKTPGRIALVYGDETISYERLSTKVRSAATLLKSKGVQRNDRIILSASSTNPAFVYGYFACHLIGAINVPVDDKIGSRSLKEIADQTQPRLSCLSFLPHLESPSIPLASLDCNYPLANEDETTSLDDIADILFTAGTTGKPKGIMQTHRNIKALSDGRSSVIGTAAQHNLVLPLSLSHGFGLGRLRCSIYAGGTIIVIDGFSSPSLLFKAFGMYHATGFCCVPSGFATLFHVTGDKLGEYRRQIKYIETATAPLPLSVKERLIRLLPDTQVYNTYGLTETTATIAFVDLRDIKHQTMPVGKPVSGVTLRIADDKGDPMPIGQPGQVLVRGDNVMKGYWCDDARTSDVLTDGWLRTNDIGRLDKDGYLYLNGRKEELINIGGIKVAPREIEDALEEHPAIKECACIGVEDPFDLSGEVIKAFMVAEASQAPKPTNDELIRFMRANIEVYKCPTQFVWVEGLPKSSAGKLQRRRLRDRENSGVGPEDGWDEVPKLIDLIRWTFSLSTDTDVKSSDGPGSLEGWDSLGHVRLLLAIQRGYKIGIEPQEAMMIETVSDIRALLRTKGISEL
jgi:long-chain acyl-CoA synthetase